jgi:hypothetical protein
VIIRAIIVSFFLAASLIGRLQAQSQEQIACVEGAKASLKACNTHPTVPCPPTIPPPPPSCHEPHANCEAIYQEQLKACQPSYAWKQVTVSDPLALTNAAYWRDTYGHVWLFGGANVNGQATNDLYFLQGGISSATWALVDTPGPSSRYSAAVAVDPTNGNAWVFGGLDSLGNRLNDLFLFTPSATSASGTWQQMSMQTPNGFPTYGSAKAGVCSEPGTSKVTGTPGGRYGSVAWVDSSHNLWVFGGAATDCTDYIQSPYYLNDLWEFVPNSGNNGGTWWWYPSPSEGYYAGGCWNPSSVAGNTPGGRYGAAYWTDSTGSLWMFGGVGFGATSSATCQVTQGNPPSVAGPLNDLWKYSGGTWTLVTGNQSPNSPGSYGTLAMSAVSNVPPARYNATAWQDFKGNFWIFGGSVGTSGSFPVAFDDLWEFDYNVKTWIWIGGSQGAPTTGTNPPAPGPRAGAAGGTFGFPVFWISGGQGPTSTALSDFWQGQGMVYDWP